MLVPRAKKESYSNAKFFFSSSLTVLANNDTTKKVFEALKIFMASSSIDLSVCSDPGKADIVLCLEPALSDKTERYTLSASETGVSMRFAAASLMQLIRFENGNSYILGAEIDD